MSVSLSVNNVVRVRSRSQHLIVSVLAHTEVTQKLYGGSSMNSNSVMVLG